MPSTETPAELVDPAWSLLTEHLEQFFPDTRLTAGAPSVTQASAGLAAERLQVTIEPGQFAVQIDWLGRTALLRHRETVTLLDSEIQLAHSTTRAMDRRFCTALEPRHIVDDTAAFALEDAIIADYLGVVNPQRLTDAVATLRAAALSTYENRQLSTGALLLGTAQDPAAPDRRSSVPMPYYDRRLSTVKGFHRLCDGQHTLFVVDLEGRLLWPVDIKRWACEVRGKAHLPCPCAEQYVDHARATVSDGHTCLVLMPSHEIKIFARGQLACAFSTARWRVLDIPAKSAIWHRVVGNDALAKRLFQAALDLSEGRHGALFVVLRDLESAEQLIAPTDRIDRPETRASVVEDIFEMGALPRQARRFLHGLVQGQGLLDLDVHVLASLASVDGAVVCDRDGRLLSFGAILRLPSDTPRAKGPSEGARTATALAISHHGPTLKISEDGLVALFVDGVKLWEM